MTPFRQVDPSDRSRFIFRAPSGGERQFGSIWSNGRETKLFPILAALCLILLSLAMLPPIAEMFLRVSNDYGEGWTAYWARAAVGGGPLYPAPDALVANNYPPLYFYVDGYLGKLVGDNIFAGRMIALLSELAVAGTIARIVHKLGAPHRWAALSGLVFLAYDAVLFQQFAVVNNPQWLGQAVALSSLLFLIGVEPARLRHRSVVAAAAVMVVAGLIKHNQFALPLAVTIWLFRYNRRACACWCLAGAIFAAAAIGLLAARYGDALFADVLGFERTVDLGNFLDGFVTIAGLSGLIAVTFVGYRPLRADPRSVLLLLYAAFGLVLGVVQRLGAGVYLNAHFDGLIGLVLVCGAFLGRAATNRLPGAFGARTRSRWLLLALAPLIAVSPVVVVESVARFLDIPRQQAAWAGMIARVHDARGPALCEMLAVCYWAGRPMGTDVFAYGQRLRTGTDPRPLERLIAQRKVAVLVVDRSKHYLRGDARLPSPLPRMIEQNYAVVLTAKRSLAVMIPRD